MIQAARGVNRIATGMLLVLLAACGGGGPSDVAPPGETGAKTPRAKLALRTFAEDCGDFLAYAADALTEQYLTPFRCPPGALCPVFFGAPTAADSSTGGPGAAAPTRVSQTNTQEAGVDEADIVKADAQGNLYILSGLSLHVLQAFPPQGLDDRPLATLALSDGSDGFFAGDFFLDEASHRLVILGQQYNGLTSDAVSVLVDVSDPAAPVETGRLAINGYGLEARRIGHRVHRVSRFDVPLPSWFYDPSDSLAQLRDEYFKARDAGDTATADRIRSDIRGQIGERVNNAGAQALLPRLSTRAAGAAPVETTLACSDVSHPEVTTGLGLALVDSFDTDGAERAASAVINNAYLVYASAANLYLAQSSFGWFFAPSQAEETAIYRLALPQTGVAAYQAMGKVDGTVLNAYSLSEHQGFLRVASTETRFSDQQVSTASHLSVLRANTADSMDIVGSLRDLAPGERIQGARFVGERGYLVTFRQVDPLMAFDLSDPAKPALADELVIPGFSSYMTPLGDDYLLTVGRAGDERQLDGQVAVQLFDVRDLHDIRQVAAISPAAGGSGFSYSVAEYDPHAFSYFADSASASGPGTLSIPLQSFGEDPSEQFSGFLVVRVDPSAGEPLAELGRIDHASLADSAQFCGGGAGETGTGGSDPTAPPCSDAVYAADPRRSVFMQDADNTYLYTLSAVGVLANSAAAPLQELGRKPLPPDPPCCEVSVTPAGG